MLDVARRARTARSLNVVALSGGVFQNVTLLSLAVDRLRGRFRRVVAPGCAAQRRRAGAGQAVVAHHQLRDG
ncbi:MAG: hypothetical protein R2851_04220 [Caldilineaceae bacterium]